MVQQKWEQDVVKHPGSFTKEAKRARKTVHQFAEEKKHAPGKLGKRARLALTFERQARQKKQGM